MRVLEYKKLSEAKGITYSMKQLRRRVAAGTFPAPVELGDHRVAWVESELDEWLRSRPRRGTAGAQVAA